ncbi:aldehyde dehydrogenase (NAD+) [Pontibacter ummariensis]|uniref:Salicylaldehyde dehydrogenase n=1 Tax=Pontibacter ummariensis TaxID=1610492 RepID=A0A239IB00_9BACT|nr:aldehyde dehydrogenase family protein [Pontibacter ummariensis]PRY09957.1 aldehyde dehydrogenase (NAD+) [Pontibacter ummariensis]SNS90592.1 aldehyde dehydrogenase (NAD+) [Pontibacter ummariensis]
MKEYNELNKQYIKGEWIDGSADYSVENLNPYDESVLNTFKGATTADVDRAFEVAKETSKSWADENPDVKRGILLKAAQILQDRKGEFVDWLVKEVGSTQLKAAIEIDQTYDMLLEASSFPTRMRGMITQSTVPGKENYIFRKPLGVVGIISPWNFPLYLSMRSIAPAIAVGNCVVVKPASQSPVTGGTILAKLFEEAGLPGGVFNVVVGKSSVIGDYFTGHPASKLISFTGSTPVGKGIGRIGGEGLKKLALELGGNNAFVILDDADVDRAVDAAVFGRFMHQAQICMSTNRILVHESLASEFTEKFIAKVKNLKVGDPREEGTVVGPLIDNKAAKRVVDLVQRTVDAGAKLALGGNAEGNVVQPTVLTGVTREMPIFNEEVFGPAVGIITFKTDEEAIELANDTEFGLSGALHTKDLLRGLQVAKRVDTGMIHINDQSVNDEPQTPFGGEKNSGVGRFGDDFIIEEMTTVQWVSVQVKPRDYPA